MYFAARRFASMKRASIMTLLVMMGKEDRTPVLVLLGAERLRQGCPGRRLGDRVGRLKGEDDVSAVHFQHHRRRERDTMNRRRSKVKAARGRSLVLARGPDAVVVQMCLVTLSRW